MAIVNRDMDPSQQNGLLECSIPTVLGVSSIVLIDIVPAPILVKSVEIAAQGLSGTPIWNFAVQRFYGGSGLTTITALTGAVTVTSMGTSGVMGSLAGTGGSGVPNGISLATTGSSLLQLIAGDVVQIVTSGAASAVLSAKVKLVVQYLQDVKTTFGS